MIDGSERSRVWVLDTSAVIEVKDYYDHDPILMLRAYDCIGEVIQRGAAVIPPEVLPELRQRAGPEDYPTTWAGRWVKHQLLAGTAYAGVRVVMQAAPSMVPLKRRFEVADPWIVAHAYELHQAGYEAVVVSEDRIDRSGHVSLRTACRLLGLSHTDTGWFLRDCNAPDPK